MSAWSEAVGWLWVVAGAIGTLGGGRLLVSRSYRRGELTKEHRAERRKELSSLRISLGFLVTGVIWLAAPSTHVVIIWLLAAYIWVLLIYDHVWSRFRKRTRRGGETA